MTNKTKRIIEIGKISSRGQIAIPSDAKRALELRDGEKVLFVVDKDTLIMKKLDVEKTWAEITEPLRKAPKKIKEEVVVDLIHRMRKAKKQ